MSTPNDESTFGIFYVKLGVFEHLLSGFDKNKGMNAAMLICIDYQAQDKTFENKTVTF